MAHTNELLRGQLEAYSEAWKKPHEEAMEYWELQEVLRLSLALYDWIRALDEHWSQAVREGHEAFTKAQAEEFERFYRAWLNPSEEILKQVTRFERNGFNVDLAERFREAWTQATLATQISVKDTLQAIHELEEGRGIPLAEVRDELRRRRLHPSA